MMVCSTGTEQNRRIQKVIFSVIHHASALDESNHLKEGGKGVVRITFHERKNSHFTFHR